MDSRRSILGRAGLVIVAIVFLVAVSISNVLLRGMRIDLTENHLYTLSDGTKNILGSIDEPINLYFFWSDRAAADVPFLRTYATRVRELLDEFVAHADGRLRVTVIDPLPFSEAEDQAAAFGLQAVSLGGLADSFYLGIAGTNSVDDEASIAFLDPNRETFLEYELARLVDTLANPQRPVVGLISSLPMDGQFDPQTQRRTEPWVIRSQIDQLFAVTPLAPTVTRIDPQVAVLLVVHPKGLSDATLYAIDQFILRGGRALLMVDPYAEADVPPQDPNNPVAAFMASRASDLNRLTGAWGITTPTEEFVADERFALQVTGLDRRPVRHIGLLGIESSGIDPQDIVTADLRNLNLGYPGFVTVADDAAADVTALVWTSDRAAPASTATLGFLRDPNQLREGFTPSGETYPIAVRISGEVPSAFADGPPEGVSGDEHLAASDGPINVVLIADTDLLTDRLWTQVQNFFGQRISTPFADNGDLVANVLDNLTGSGDLIGVRARATFSRPFTRVQDLRLEAENRFRETEQRLQQELRDTEARLSELQAGRDDAGTAILTPEQEAELERFRDERLRIRKELRQVRRNLDQQIENLGAWLKVINIGLMPTLITLVSIVLLIARRGRRQKHSSGGQPR